MRGGGPATPSRRPDPPQGELQRILPTVPRHTLGSRRLLPRRSGREAGAHALEPRVPRLVRLLSPAGLPRCGGPVRPRLPVRAPPLLSGLRALSAAKVRSGQGKTAGGGITTAWLERRAGGDRPLAGGGTLLGSRAGRQGGVCPRGGGGARDGAGLPPGPGPAARRPHAGPPSAGWPRCTRARAHSGCWWRWRRSACSPTSSPPRCAPHSWGGSGHCCPGPETEDAGSAELDRTWAAWRTAGRVPPPTQSLIKVARDQIDPECSLVGQGRFGGLRSLEGPSPGP